VLIQFGHNDSHEPGRPESTDPQTEFPANLRRYVEEARAIGATPILLTPVVRRIFGQDERLAGELQPYAEATSRVAAEMQVPLIDVPSSSRALVESLAPEGSAAMANAPGDRTHFNDPGAKAMAELVKKELPTAPPQLQKHLSQRERASELCGAFRQGAITAGPAEVSLRDDLARRAFPLHTSWTCEILKARRASADPGLSFFLLHQVVAATHPDLLSPLTAAAAPRPPSHL